MKSPQTNKGGVNMIRIADIHDLDLLIKIDLDDEGVTPTHETQRSKEDIELHKEKIRNFIVDQDKGGLYLRGYREYGESRCCHVFIVEL